MLGIKKTKTGRGTYEDVKGMRKVLGKETNMGQVAGRRRSGIPEKKPQKDHTKRAKDILI